MLAVQENKSHICIAPQSLSFFSFDSIFFLTDGRFAFLTVCPHLNVEYVFLFFEFALVFEVFVLFVVINLCLFGHTNHLFTTLAETGKNRMLLHTQVSRRTIPCMVDQALLGDGKRIMNYVLLVVFPGNVPTNAQFVTLKMQDLSSSYISSITIPLPNSVIESDLTDIYMTENLLDYYCCPAYMFALFPHVVKC